MAKRRGGGAATVMKKNAPPSPNQQSLFERLTGYCLPNRVTTREGA